MDEKDLHAKIMNIPCDVARMDMNSASELMAYKLGHRDARHAAAELAAALSQKTEPGAITFDNPSYPAWLAENQGALTDEYEGRVTRYMALVRQSYKPDWPYTSIFDDGGVAWRDAMARVAAEQPLPAAPAPRHIHTRQDEKKDGS